MKRSTFNILFYLNTSKQKKNGRCPVMGRITVDGTIAQFSLKADTNRDSWDVAKGRTTGKSRECTALNRKIGQTEQSIRDIYQRILETTGYVTAEQVKNELTGRGEKTESLLELFGEHNREYEKRVGIDRTKDSYYVYKNSFRHLSGFIRFRYGLEDYPLKQLDMNFINDYDFYLRTECGINANSLVKHIIILKKMVTRAINRGIIRRDPFAAYTIDRPKGSYKYLSAEELEKLLTTEIEPGRICFVRDMFVFACFTGLAYADLCSLGEEHLRREADGSLWIDIRRRKTGRESNIRLLDIPLRIIEKYRTERTGDRLFNMINRGSISSSLRKIEKLCGIEHLHFHMSRHSFATQVCMANGVPMETISKMMGHNTIRSTQIYAEITNQKVDSDMKKLAARIGGKYAFPGKRGVARCG